jgi:hypothetical protein
LSINNTRDPDQEHSQAAQATTGAAALLLWRRRLLVLHLHTPLLSAIQLSRGVARLFACVPEGARRSPGRLAGGIRLGAGSRLAGDSCCIVSDHVLRRWSLAESGRAGMWGRRGVRTFAAGTAGPGCSIGWRTWLHGWVGFEGVYWARSERSLRREEVGGEEERWQGGWVGLAWAAAVNARHFNIVHWALRHTPSAFNNCSRGFRSLAENRP